MPPLPMAPSNPLQLVHGVEESDVKAEPCLENNREVGKSEKRPTHALLANETSLRVKCWKEHMTRSIEESSLHSSIHGYKYFHCMEATIINTTY